MADRPEAPGIPAPLFFDDVPTEYRAARMGCALLDAGDRGRVTARGPDGADFLHRLLANHVKSLPVGGVNENGEPHGMVTGEAQNITGGVVSTMVTTWLHVAMFVQQSTACHVCVMMVRHELLPALVTIPRLEIVTFVPQQESIAVGGSKLHETLHWTVLLLAQEMTGGVVSVITMVSTHVAVLVQQSTADQVFVT